MNKTKILSDYTKNHIDKKTGKNIRGFYCKIELQDLINFQEVEFKIVRGFYWNGKKNHSINRIVKELHELRKTLKKQGSPLEQIVKLILNSYYGKSTQKTIKLVSNSTTPNT